MKKVVRRASIYTVSIFLLISLLFLYLHFRLDAPESDFYFDFDEDDLTVFDDKGFPSVSFSFNCSSFVKVKVLDDASEEVNIDYFVSNAERHATMRLGSYKETLSDGSYFLEFYDSLNKKFFSYEICLERGVLELSDFNVYQWSNGEQNYIVGLNITVENTGVLPIYLDEVCFNNSFQVFNGSALIEVIDPYEKTFVDCVVFDKLICEADDFMLEVFDSDDNLLKSGFFKDVGFLDLKQKIYKNISCNSGVLSLPYPGFLYNYYKNKDRFEGKDYSAYIFEEHDDKFIDMISDVLSQCYPNETGFDNATCVDQVNYVASFVQQINYTSDLNETGEVEYAKYPIETLFDNGGGGDCEDKAILAGSILDSLGYNVTLIEFNDHMGLGVELEEEALPETDFFISNYYYLETSNLGNIDGDFSHNVFRLGDTPVNYTSSMVVSLYEISNRYIVNHYWTEGSFIVFKNSPLGNLVKVSLIVENLGVSDAFDIEVRGIVYSNDSLFGGSYDEFKTISCLPAGKKMEISLVIGGLDSGREYFFKTRLLVDGSLEDELKSEGTFII